ncbi:MAG: hypothetical protein U0836_10325 [Pirellulales bacterium]
MLAASAVAWGVLVAASFGQGPPQQPPASTPVAPAAPTTADEPQPATSLWELQPKTESNAGPAVEVDPELVYLPDENGRPTRLLGWRMADFLRAWRWMQAGLSQPPADWELTTLSLSGEERNGRAEFAARLELRVHGQGWREAPLDLREAILLTPPDQIEFTGAKEQRFEVDPKGRGYVWRVRAEGEAVCSLQFRCAAVLSRRGREQRCALHLPAAATSKIELICGNKVASATTVAGAYLTPIEALPESRSRLAVEGGRGDFWLAWQTAPEGAPSATLEAESRTSVSVDGAFAQIDVDLQVRAFDGALAPFEVRAPASWRLRSAAASDQAALAPLAADRGAATPGWRVSPLAGDARNVRIPFQFSVPLESVGGERLLKIEGLEVSGAVRHTGRVRVGILDESRTTWQTVENAQRVLVSPAEGSGVSRPADYAFETYRQPFRIEAGLTRPTPQVAVEPRYEIEVDRLGARLTAALRISPQAGRLASFQLVRQGWTIDRLEPAESVAFETEELESAESLTAGLRMPSSGPVELQLRAHRNWAEPPPVLSFGLPYVQADAQSPAPVVVRPAENVLLVPLGGQIEGLLREPPTAADRTFSLNFRGDAPRGRLAFEMQVQPRRVTVRSRVQAQLGADRAAFEQELIYRADFEPLDMIDLELPTALWNANRLSVTLAGEELAGVADAARAPDAPLQRVRYRLPRPQLGSFQVRLSSTVALGNMRDPQGRATWTLPLAGPLDGRLEQSSALVRAAAAADLVPGPGPWKPAAAGELELAEGLLLETTERTTSLTLLQSPAAATRETVVERAWIQSWYLAAVRQERVVLRLRTRAAQFACSLPPEAESAGLTVSLRSGDGGQATDLDAPSLLGADNRVVVPLPRTAQGDDRYIVELRYPCPEVASESGRILHPPGVGQGVWVQQVCWQLLLPPDEHVVSRPLGYSHEFAWGWRHLYWGRQPTVDQLQLEAWSGAEQSGFEPRDASQYIFSTQGELRPLVVSTVRRSTLVLALSLVGFVGVVAVWRIPAAYRAAAVSAAAALVALVALWRPEAAALGLQAAVLGLLLGSISMWLERRWVAGRPTLVSAPSSSWSVQRGSSITRSVVAPSMASTSSAPSLLTPDDEEQGEST